MRKCFATAMGSVVALVGFAGAANASATVDLIWIDVTTVDSNGNPICLRPSNRNCPQLGTTLTSVALTDTITLGLIITAGAGGLAGAGVSVDYSDAIPELSVSGFQSLTTTVPASYLPASLGVTSDMPPFVDNFSAVAAIPGALGLGLPAGQSAYLGTVSFHRDQLANGTFEIAVGAFGPSGTDGVGNLAGQDINSTTAFNSAFVVDHGPTATPTATPTPICSPEGASCQNGSDCCSNKCSGPGGNKVCQPGPTPTASPSATPSATPTPTPTATPTTTPVSNCCSDHAGTGCDDSSCEATVCGLDAFCCAIAWDDRCAAWANNVCSVCGAATPTPTATPTATPTPMPEPSALTALGSGIAVLALLYRRRSAFLRSRIFYG